MKKKTITFFSLKFNLRQIKFGIVFLSCLFISSCFQMTFYSDIDRLRPEPDGETSHVSTVFGIIELDDSSSLRELCPSGVSKLNMRQSVANGAFHYFSLGFYSPQTSTVWCKRRFR